MLKEAPTSTENKRTNKDTQGTKQHELRSKAKKREVIRLATTTEKGIQANKKISEGFREPHFYSLVSSNTFGPSKTTSFLFILIMAFSTIYYIFDF